MRHKQCGFLLLLITLFFTACKSDSDVMATFKGGEITRKNFYDWLYVKKYNKDTILEKKKNQQDKLEMMGMDKIAVIEAKKSGYDKNKDFIGINKLSLDNMLVNSFMQENIIENAKKKNTILKVDHIFLSFRSPVNPKVKDKRSKEEIRKEKEALAATIIASLQKGTSFAKLAKEHSEDFTRHKGGEVGYIVEGMRSPEYTKTASALKIGEYTKKPFVDRNGMYIIKLVAKEEVTLESIEDLVKDKRMATRIISFLKRKNVTSYLEQLKGAKDVVFNEDNILKKKGKNLIYSVGDIKFTCDDLDSLVGLYTRRQQPVGGKPTPLSDRQRAQFAKKLYELELIKRDALKQKYNEGGTFKYYQHEAEDIILAREYMNFLKNGDITITEKDMREEYEKNKDRIYMRRKKATKSKKTEKEIIPYAQAKERIKNKLYAEEISKRVKDWESKMKQQYALVIKQSELSGD